jgi:hypothetical protein
MAVYAEVAAHDLNHRLRPAFMENIVPGVFLLGGETGLFEIGAKRNL